MDLLRVSRYECTAVRLICEVELKALCNGASGRWWKEGGLFLARKRLGLIWGGDLPWLNSLVVAKKPKSKKTKEIPWPNIRQSCISCSVMSPAG